MKNKNMSLTEWNEYLQTIFEGTSREAIRFYNLEILPRLLFLLQNKCTKNDEFICYFNTLYDLTLKMPEWIKNESSEIKIFEEEMQKLNRFLTKEHGYYPRGWWFSRFTGIGVIAGIAVGIIVTLIIAEKNTVAGMIATGGCAGMILGGVAGKIKEYHLKRNRKLF